MSGELLAKEKNIFSQVMCFCGEGNGRGFIKQIPSLVLIRKFQTDWFQISLLGEAKTVIRLVSFGLGMWLSKSDFWPFFKTEF